MFTRQALGGGAFSDGVLRRAVSLVASVSLALSLALSPIASIAPAATGTCSSATADAATLDVLDDDADADVVDWTACGTCEWSIDSDGLLSIRPADGAETGTLETMSSTTVPWRSQRKSIVTVSVESGVSAGKSLTYAFYGCTNLVACDLSGLDTSGTTTMSYVFEGCASLAAVDLSGLDTSSVTTMRDMFYGCESLASLDLSGFDTSSVTTMAYMFEGCSSLTSLDLTNFDTSIVTTMVYMFEGCSSLTSLDLTGFDTALVADMQYMFHGCTSLASVDLSTLDTTTVEDMSYMFYNCTSLKTLDLTSFNTSRVYNMWYMFYNCTSLKTLDISSFNTANVSIMSYMFTGCTALRTVVLGASFGFDNSSSYLPSPVHETYGTGLWADTDGNTYSPSSIPDYTAQTYTAVFEVDGSYVVVTEDDDDAVSGLTEGTDDATDLSADDDDSAGAVAAVVTLSQTSYTYDGTAKKPTVTVTVDGTELVEYVDFVVIYSDNIDVGTATATVWGINNYAGSVSVTFSIVAATLSSTSPSSSSGGTSSASAASATAPKTTVASLKSTKKGVLVARAAKKSGVSYQFRWRVAGTKAWKTSAAAAKATRTIKGLKSGKRYQVQVRTKKSASGKTVWSAWSNAKSAKVR